MTLFVAYHVSGPQFPHLPSEEAGLDDLQCLFHLSDTLILKCMCCLLAVSRTPALVSLSTQRVFIQCLLDAGHCGGESDGHTQAVPKSSRLIYLKDNRNSNLAQVHRCSLLFLFLFPFQGSIKRPAPRSHTCFLWYW